MTQSSQFATQGYALADALHVQKAANKHWAALQALGATEAERKRFGSTIAAATAIAGQSNSGPVALEEARQRFKDLLGGYRSAASLVVYGIEGRDSKAETALRMKGSFPDTDAALAAYLDGLAAAIKPYAAKLAARGFSREQQAELSAAGKAFTAAVAARGLERGAARAATLSREQTFKQLRTETTYFRKLGHESQRSTLARAEFDRVKLPGKAAAKPDPAKEAAKKEKRAAKGKKAKADKSDPAGNDASAAGNAASSADNGASSAGGTQTPGGSRSRGGQERRRALAESSGLGCAEPARLGAR